MSVCHNDRTLLPFAVFEITVSGAVPASTTTGDTTLYVAADVAIKVDRAAAVLPPDAPGYGSEVVITRWRSRPRFTTRQPENATAVPKLHWRAPQTGVSLKKPAHLAASLAAHAHAM